MNTAVREIIREKGFFRVLCENGDFTARCVVNCAGLSADRLNFTLGVNDIGIVPTRADYIVTDDSQGRLISRVIFYETENKGKGLTLVPTTEGNLLIGPSEKPVEGTPDPETRKEGIDFVRECAALVLPGLDLGKTIRAFAGLRPNPFRRERLPDGSWGISDESIKDFALIMMPEACPGYISFAGIKTPGMTCADMLGALAAKRCAEYLDAGKNPDFDPKNPPEDKAGGEIVCRCKKVTEGEIVRAIKTCPGAVTVDGVKRRTGACLGVCQGARCTDRIVQIISRELGIPTDEVLKGEKGSWLTRKNTTLL
ncbi:MAG: FAD-dependent oxidoreductase [Oscillospiraceae bacterium]|nr:FAD-dependent oxidoreductase [Oscillospiraceae bacterium]